LRRVYEETAALTERDIFKALEPVMVFSVILAILLWQWWSIRREIKKDREKEKVGRAETQRPPTGVG
jgi:hypothetical protein